MTRRPPAWEEAQGLGKGLTAWGVRRASAAGLDIAFFLAAAASLSLRTIGLT